MAMSGYRNCHARGVHSIVLRKQEDRLVRIFLAEENHTLWRNTRIGSAPLSVGFHSHHCEVEILCRLGRIGNMVMVPTIFPDHGQGRLMESYRYHSPLRGETPRFEKVAEARRFSAHPQMLAPGESVVLHARDVHTIYVSKGKRAAWMVYEGAEDPGYEPLTYSDDDLSSFDWTGMYQPMSEDECRAMLEGFGLEGLARWV